MGLKNNLLNGVIGVFTLLLLTTSCNDDNESNIVSDQFSGTLTVLQKDAYSNVAGRSSKLWLPHTTTVFKWDEGTTVQKNHGTAPNERDSEGELFLEEIIVYKFSGTEEQMEKLEEAYKKAVYDDGAHKFLDLENGEGELAKGFLSGLKHYIADGDNLFTCEGTNKADIIRLFELKKFNEITKKIDACNFTKTDWSFAFAEVLGDVLGDFGHNINDYHVCNDDAVLQVDLIKNYIKTGEIKIPELVNDGPMWYYTPTE